MDNDLYYKQLWHETCTFINSLCRNETRFRVNITPEKQAVSWVGVRIGNSLTPTFTFKYKRYFHIREKRNTISHMLWKLVLLRQLRLRKGPRNSNKANKTLILLFRETVIKHKNIISLLMMRWYHKKEKKVIVYRLT